MAFRNRIRYRKPRRLAKELKGISSDIDTVNQMTDVLNSMAEAMRELKDKSPDAFDGKQFDEAEKSIEQLNTQRKSMDKIQQGVDSLLNVIGDNRDNR